MTNISTTLIIIGAKYIVFVLALLALLYFLFLKFEKKVEIFLFTVITIPIIYLVSVVARLLYFNPRPFAAGNFTPLVAHVPDNGFPSDHTLLASAVASIIFCFDKQLGMIAWLLTFIVATSRVLAGVHHIVDVIASMLISIIVSYLVYKYFYPMIKKIYLK